MKPKLVIAAVPLFAAAVPLFAVLVFAVLACGGSGSGGTYTLSSGSYGLSGTSALAPDDCNLGEDFPDGTVIQIAVAQNNVTFSFETPPNASHDPVAPVQGNTINAGAKSFDKDNNANPPGETFDCVETITLTVSGRLVATDQLQGTLLESSVRKSGTQCTPAALNYKTHPCSSTLNFTAKKR